MTLLDASAEVVRTLRAEGLSFSEIARLCAIPYAVTSLSRLEQGTATRVSKGTHDALQAGYARYLDGDRSYVKRRGTRPGVADEVLPASPRQPVLLNPESRLVKRLKARKEAA